MPRKLGHRFFKRPADQLAPSLLGKILVHRVKGQILRGRIVETEAYVGPCDLAAHSSKGRTRRTEVMFGPAGRAYVYLIYGMHEMFNIVAGQTGCGHAVLIRAAEPLDEWNANLSGPGRLARAFQFTRAQNGWDLTGDEIYLEADRAPAPPIAKMPRIGVDYAGEWKHALLRFANPLSPAVSKPRPSQQP